MESKQLIEQFYSSFQALNSEGMNACYHDSIVFHDPAFGELKGEDAKAMWSMLCSSAQDFRMEYSQIEVAEDGKTGKAHWEAWYTFSQTGRKVHNIIDASFELQDGLIIRHTDVFNVKKWSVQALGFTGRLMGGTKFFQKKLQARTRSLLEKYKSRSETS